jgi:hypothetical protein
MVPARAVVVTEMSDVREGEGGMKACVLFMALLVVASAPLSAQTLADVNKNVDDDRRWLGTRVSPEVPSTPTPASGATGVALTPTLSWQGGGATSGALVMYGTTSTPNLTAGVASNNTITLPALQPGTKYFWQVTAKNPFNVTGIKSVVFNFTTAALPPPPPVLTIACPSNVNLSIMGTTVNATYALPTTTNGTAPITTTCVPMSGSAFPLGTTTVSCNAQDAALTPQKATCAFTVTAVATSPTPSPDGAQMPPAPQIIDDSNAVWTLGVANARGFFAILKNGSQFAGAFGRGLLKCPGGTMWLSGDDSTVTWYPVSGASFDFARVTTVMPCAALPPSMHSLMWNEDLWNGTPVDGFFVSYGTRSQAYTQMNDVGHILLYTPPNLTHGLPYYFAVQAYVVKADGTRDVSSFSSEVVGIP